MLYVDPTDQTPEGLSSRSKLLGDQLLRPPQRHRAPQRLRRLAESGTVPLTCHEDRFAGREKFGGETGQFTDQSIQADSG